MMNHLKNFAVGFLALAPWSLTLWLFGPEVLTLTLLVLWAIAFSYGVGVMIRLLIGAEK